MNVPKIDSIDVMCLVLAVEESEKIVQTTLNEFENPKNCGTTCTAGLTLTYVLCVQYFGRVLI